jgi:hypothetical protein
MNMNMYEVRDILVYFYMFRYEHEHEHVQRSGLNLFCFNLKSSGLNLNVVFPFRNMWTKSICFCFDVETFGLNLMFLF